MDAGTRGRPFDVVLFGATGFTGRLVARYLARSRSLPPQRWAIAGRSPGRLAEVRETLEAVDPECKQVTLLEASVDEPASLRRMAESARVLATTVGPYARYGLPVVEACIDAGTDYADITGEPEFVDRVLTRCDDVAREKRLRIVSCCGFDSIPPDLGTFVAVRALADGGPPAEPVSVEAFVRGAGTFSGGTLHSALEAMARLGETRRRLAERLREERTPDGRRARASRRTLHYDRELGAWAVALPTIDPWIVLRSARALPMYGSDFTYGHYARVSRLPWLLAGMAGVGALAALAQVGPTRRLLGRLRAPGEGPSEAERARASFQVLLRARAGASRVRVEVSGGDPGYDETAKMLGESALCLALDRGALPDRKGVITPAVAMGDLLVQRLRRAGMRFEVT